MNGDQSEVDLDSVKHVHLLGIGGVGVSAVARLLLARNIRVSGSDVRESSITRALREEGAAVTIGHHPDNLAGAGLVVASTAIPAVNPELRAAREADLPVAHRSVVLGALMKGKRSLGVTGTNGKGSVSAVMTWLLEAAGLDPSFAIGALLLNFGTNARAAEGPHLVCELDESDGSFANTGPDVLVINNLEADHLNYYRDLDGLPKAFSDYLAAGPPPKRVHANGDDRNVRRVLDKADRDAITHGQGPTCTYRIEGFEARGMGSRFRLFGPPGDLGWFEIRVPGLYNTMNAAAALSVVLEEGVAVEAAREALPAYEGMENRFSVIQCGECRVVKDYVSHPTGIRSVIEAARAMAKGRIVAVFKPYRFTMIHYLQDEYRTAFEGTDLALVTKTYTAGEVPIEGVDDDFLVDKIRSSGSEVLFVPSMEDIGPTLMNLIQAGDTVVFFGGDDLFQVADGFARDLDQGAP